MNACSWTQVPYSALTEETKKIAQDRVAWLFAELPLTSEEKESLKYAFMKTPYKDWGSKFFAERTKEPYKPPPYPNEYKGIKKRKISSLSEIAETLPKIPDEREDYVRMGALLENGRYRREFVNNANNPPPLENVARGRNFIAPPLGNNIPG